MIYTQPLLRVRAQKGDLWLTLGSKHAPFGYVPAEVRGMPAIVFSGDGWENTRSPAAGTLDSAATEGKGRPPPVRPPASRSRRGPSPGWSGAGPSGRRTGGGAPPPGRLTGVGRVPAGEM